MSKLATVHDAAREASLETKADRSLATTVATLRIDPAIKTKAESILDLNGTTLSAFLRWCTVLLVRDYNPAATRPGEPILPFGRRD